MMDLKFYNNKKLLLLIHPDVVFEMNDEFSKNYINKVLSDLHNFDYVIVHFLFPPQIIMATEIWKNKKDIHNFIDILKSTADFAEYRRDIYSASFKKELPDFLIDNPGTIIYMAGGYENLCVKITNEMLDEKLSDIIKETNTKLVCYTPLIIKNRDQLLSKSLLNISNRLDKIGEYKLADKIDYLIKTINRT